MRAQCRARLSERPHGHHRMRGGVAVHRGTAAGGERDTGGSDQGRVRRQVRRRMASHGPGALPPGGVTRQPGPGSPPFTVPPDAATDSGLSRVCVSGTARCRTSESHASLIRRCRDAFAMGAPSAGSGWACAAGRTRQPRVVKGAAVVTEPRGPCWFLRSAWGPGSGSGLGTQRWRDRSSYRRGCLNGGWWTPIRTMPTVRSVCRSSGRAVSAVTVGVLSGRTK